MAYGDFKPQTELTIEAAQQLGGFGKAVDGVNFNRRKINFGDFDDIPDFGAFSFEEYVNRKQTTPRDQYVEPSEEDIENGVQTYSSTLENYADGFPESTKEVLLSREFLPSSEATSLEPYSKGEQESLDRNYKAFSKRLEKYSNDFDEVGEEYGVSPEVLKALAMTESGIRPDAISQTGAIGMMQLFGNTAKSYGITAGSSNRRNIEAGASEFVKKKNYLRRHYPKYSEQELEDLAIRAYNSGQAYWNPNSDKTMDERKRVENLGHHKKFNYYLFRLKKDL